MILKLKAITKNSKVNFYLNKKGEHFNLQNLPKEFRLDEILINETQIIASEEPIDGLLSVVYSFDGKTQTDRFPAREKLKIVFETFERLFGFKAGDFLWTFKDKEYSPTADSQTELIEMTDQEHMVFIITSLEVDAYKVDLLLIDDTYDTKRNKKIHSLTFRPKPTFEKLLHSIGKALPSLEAYLFYKINNFDEPVKEISLRNLNEIPFDSENCYRIMVKSTSGKLDFQILRFVIYTVNAYPQDLQKKLDLKIEDEMTVGEFKKEVLKNLVANDISFGNDPQKCFFQFLNQFNIPSKYLLQDKSPIKKHAQKSNKLLVRRKDFELPKNEDFIAVFCRERIYQKRIYEGFRQVFIPKKLQKMSVENISKLKLFLVDKLGLDVEGEALGLSVVNYKNYEWKKLDKGEISLKDGDEIGFLVKGENCAGDDMQTDELLALAGSENRENYVFNYKFVKEKPFAINLD